MNLINTFNVWLKEIDASEEGSTVIDICSEFEKLFSRNIITICFGEDVSDEKFEIMVFRSGDASGFIPKVMGMSEALHMLVKQLRNSYSEKIWHPSNWNFKKNGVLHPARKEHYHIKDNIKKI